MNEIAGSHGTGAVGIFWVLTERNEQPTVLADLVPITQGEPYGEFLTYGGHYAYWERLASLSVSELHRRGLPAAPAWSEYEEWPRGRVVYHQPTQRFILYADRKLWRRPLLNLLLARFDLQNAAFDLRGDPHYVSLRPVNHIGAIESDGS